MCPFFEKVQSLFLSKPVYRESILNASPLTIFYNCHEYQRPPISASKRHVMPADNYVVGNGSWIREKKLWIRFANFWLVLKPLEDFTVVPMTVFNRLIFLLSLFGPAVVVDFDEEASRLSSKYVLCQAEVETCNACHRDAEPQSVRKGGEMGLWILGAFLFLPIFGSAVLVVKPQEEAGLSTEYLLRHAEVVSKHREKISNEKCEISNVKCQISNVKC